MDRCDFLLILYIWIGTTINKFSSNQKFHIGRTLFKSTDGKVEEQFDTPIFGKTYKLPSNYAEEKIHILATSSTEGSLDPQPVILNVHQGNGRAILSQIPLEMSPDNIDIEDEKIFDKLKKSNSYRFSVFAECLSILRLKRGCTVVPTLTPAYLLGETYVSNALFDNPLLFNYYMVE